MREPSVWKGVVAGLAGGLAASFAMGPVHQYASKLSAARGRSTAIKGEDATVKAAESVTKAVADHPLNAKEKKIAGPLVHFAFGGGMGAAYGAVAEYWPVVESAVGLPFGAAVWLGAHAGAVPALGLSKPVTKSDPTSESAEAAAHLVYGAVTEMVRRGVRKLLG
jgi:putative membrane protein